MQTLLQNYHQRLQEVMETLTFEKVPSFQEMKAEFDQVK